MLHSMEIAEGDSCELITILFSPSIFTSGKATSVYLEITAPVYNNQGFTTKIFSNSSSWENEILSCIKTAYSAYQENIFSKKLTICENLTHIWILILNHSLQKEINNVIFNPLQENRTQIMMQFIQEHYSEHLSINAITNSAGVSTRECSRCFQNIIHTPPVKYLIKYRISVSVSLLLTTNHSMTQIAIMVGFNSLVILQRYLMNACICLQQFIKNFIC